MPIVKGVAKRVRCSYMDWVVEDTVTSGGIIHAAHDTFWLRRREKLDRGGIPASVPPISEQPSGQFSKGQTLDSVPLESYISALSRGAVRLGQGAAATSVELRVSVKSNPQGGHFKRCCIKVGWKAEALSSSPRHSQDDNRPYPVSTSLLSHIVRREQQNRRFRDLLVLDTKKIERRQEQPRDVTATDWQRHNLHSCNSQAGPLQRYLLCTQDATRSYPLPLAPTSPNDTTVEKRLPDNTAENGVIGVLPGPVYEIAAGFGSSLSVVYLGTLVTMLLGAAYVVAREVIVRVEMDEAVKRLGDNIRAGNATSEEYYELAAVLIRKKLYIQAIKNLEKSISLWEDDEVELAQVYNAMGYCYFGLEKDDQALTNYKKAVELRPNYVSAWNNLGDTYERTQQWKEGYMAYKKALEHDKENKVALERAEFLKKKLERLGIPA